MALTGRFNVTVSQILLFLAFLVAVLGLRDQPWPVLIGASAIVAGALLILAYVFRPETINLSSNEDVLVSAGLPTPSTHCQISGDAFAIFYGTNVSVVRNFPHTVLRMGGEDMIAIDKTPKSGELVIKTLRIFDDRDDIIARIDEDGFWVQNTVRKKRPDKSTLKVFDHNDHEVLDIQLVNERTLKLTGVFRHRLVKPSYVIVSDDALVHLPVNTRFTNNCIHDAHVAIQIGN